MTLSLADMAQRVQLSSPQEAEKYVLHMVSNSTKDSPTILIFLLIVSVFIGMIMCIYHETFNRLKMEKYLLQSTRKTGWFVSKTTLKNITAQACLFEFMRR